VYPLLADSFQFPGLKARLRYWWLGRSLAHPKNRWVTNHNLNVSRDLVRIGVPARKVVPFDWPPVVSPSDFSPKREAANADAPRLLYVGQVRIGSDRKGRRGSHRCDREPRCSREAMLTVDHRRRRHRSAAPACCESERRAERRVPRGNRAFRLHACDERFRERYPHRASGSTLPW
jgi:hypothetical protein